MWSISTNSVVTPTILTGPGGTPRTGVANGISPDGSYIVGALNKTGSALPFQLDGAVWNRTQPTNPTIVPDLSDPFPSTRLRDVSNTGLAVGVSAQTGYRWTSAAGGSALSTTNASTSWAAAVNGNGTVIVGSANDLTVAHPVAVRWTSGVYSVLDYNYSAAYGVSPNGQYIAGASDVINNAQLELDVVYWKDGQRQILRDGDGAPIAGQALWATDSGIIGGFSGPPGSDPVDAWIYIEGMRSPISFDTWWKQLTGTTFPIDVTSTPAAVERNGELYLALEGGAYFAQVQWAAPADGNRDRVVDGADYTIWADNYLQSTNVSFATGDYSGDGKVDGADYTIWADNFNPTGAQTLAAAAVPEPASAILALCAGGAWLALVGGRRLARRRA